MKKRYYSKRRRRARARLFIILGVILAALAAGAFFFANAFFGEPSGTPEPETTVLAAPSPSDLVLATEDAPEPEALPEDLAPHAVAGKTDAAAFGITTGIMVDGVEVESYKDDGIITFGAGAEYTALEGVITFRGNNYRDMPSFGTADITHETLTLVNTVKTKKIGKWGGLAWTGQPLVVKWPDELRSKMTSLYEGFKSKYGFTEVIIPALDGYIYFQELSTGEKTRDSIKIGAPVKGTASLDPRGYPILYVGQGLQPDGDDESSRNMYFRAYSLIDGKLLLKVGDASRDPFALRGWQAYDSSPLIDAETDTLIQPGENGVLYVLRLGTIYNKEAGTVTMEPGRVVKYRYTSPRNEATKTWGVENSAVAWRNYLMFTDNIGLLQCVDLRTMELVYANDMGNDSDVSMVLEEDAEAGTFYLYTGCEYDDSVAGKPGEGVVYARKIDGLTGEVLWTSEGFTALSPEEGVDGGILASPVLGRDGTSMAGLVIYNMTQQAKGDKTASELVAFDKLTGKIRWRYDMDTAGWSPSSPSPVYTADGQGYIVQCDYDGEVALLKVSGQMCEEVYKLSLANTDKEEWNRFEATPVVFGNYIVVGSRSSNLFFIKIS